MTLRTTATLAVGLAACAAMTGCDQFPVTVSGEFEPPGVYEDSYEEWEIPVDLEVELDELELDVGVSLSQSTPTVAGYQSGQSTFFEIEAVSDQGVPVLVIVDLCPIEDVIVYGEESSAFLYVGVTAGERELWAEADIEVVVTESSETTERTVSVTTHFPDGGHIDVTLRYEPPL